MNIDLSFWLFVTLALFSVILLLNHFLFKPMAWFKEEPWFVEIAHSFFGIVALVFVLRSFVFEPFQIPSGSMIPTLKIGDFIVVNKFAYGFRMPVFNVTLIEMDQPKRGDVMVFKPPNDNRHFIKRVIGLPGDVIEFDNNQLIINGQPVVQKKQRQITHDFGLGPQATTLYQSVLDGAEFTIQTAVSTYNPMGKSGRYVVPAGHYFMVGDNRDGSADSRSCFGKPSICNQPPNQYSAYSRGWSAVPEKNIIGKAVYIWLHWDQFFSIPSISRNKKIK